SPPDRRHDQIDRARRKAPVEALALRHVADRAAPFVRRLAEHLDRSARGRHEPEHRLQERALARAVRPREADELALPAPERADVLGLEHARELAADRLGEAHGAPPTTSPSARSSTRTLLSISRSYVSTPCVPPTGSSSWSATPAWSAITRAGRGSSCGSEKSATAPLARMADSTSCM